MTVEEYWKNSAVYHADVVSLREAGFDGWTIIPHRRVLEVCSPQQLISRNFTYHNDSYFIIEDAVKRVQNLK